MKIRAGRRTSAAFFCDLEGMLVEDEVLDALDRLFAQEIWMMSSLRINDRNEFVLIHVTPGMTFSEPRSIRI